MSRTPRDLGGGIRIAFRGTLPKAPIKENRRNRHFPELIPVPQADSETLPDVTVKNPDSLLASTQFQFEGGSDAVSHCGTLLFRDVNDSSMTGYLPQYNKTVISTRAEYHEYKKQCKTGLPYLFAFSEDIWRYIIRIIFDGYDSKQKSEIDKVISSMARTCKLMNNIFHSFSRRDGKWFYHDTKYYNLVNYDPQSAFNTPVKRGIFDVSRKQQSD